MEALVLDHSAPQPERSRFKRRLGVITHVPHWCQPDGRIWAYEPYVRELRLWADLFESVEILAPRAEGNLEGNQIDYQRQNIDWRPFNYCQSYTRFAPLQRLSQMPMLAYQIDRLIADCDLIHLRSPGHPALVGHLLVRLRRKASIVKWAGLFDAFPGERLPSRVERRLVRWKSARHPVLVYGPAKYRDMISFLPALMTEIELERARNLSSKKRFGPPWHFLSVGRLLEVKNFDLAIRGLGILHRKRPDLEFDYTLIGSGPEASALHELAHTCNVGQRIHFKGALGFHEVQKYYAEAQLVIMPGVKEGWPKIIAESWAHAAVPVAASAGIVPWILQDEKYGVGFTPSPSALADVLIDLLEDQIKFESLLRRIDHLSETLSLECFKARLQEVLVERCGLSLA